MTNYMCAAHINKKMSYYCDIGVSICLRCFTKNPLYVMGKALSGELPCMQTGLVTKGNNFCIILFDLLYDETLPEMCVYIQEIICSWVGGGQILSFMNWPPLRWVTKRK